MTRLVYATRRSALALAQCRAFVARLKAAHPEVEFVEEQIKKGVFIAGAGLQPLSKATRVRLAKGKITVTDGPFTEAKEVVGGYSLIEDTKARFIPLPPKSFIFQWLTERNVRWRVYHSGLSFFLLFSVS